MGKNKTKAIQVDLGIFMHISAYSDLFRYIPAYCNQAYSGIIQDIFKMLCNPGIFKTLIHAGPWHTQNPGMFRSLVYSA